MSERLELQKTITNLNRINRSKTLDYDNLHQKHEALKEEMEKEIEYLKTQSTQTIDPFLLIERLKELVK